VVGAQRALPVSDDALGVVVAQDQSQLFVSRRDGIVVAYDARTGAPIGSYRAHGGNAYAVAYDAERECVLSVGGHGELARRYLPVRFARD
jgi:hypothetical protein